MRKELLSKVAISNKFVQCVQVDLSVSEWKLFMYCVSKIKIHHKLFFEGSIPIKDVRETFGISASSVIKNAVCSLDQTYVDVKSDHFKLYEYIYIENKCIIYRFPEEMKEHLLGLTKKMSVFELGRICQLNSKYAIRLYMFGKSICFSHYYNVSQIQVQNLFKLKIYKSEFIRRVLEPAFFEIKEKTDIYLCAKFVDDWVAFGACEKNEVQKKKYNTEEWIKEIKALPDRAVICYELFKDFDFDKL